MRYRIRDLLADAIGVVIVFILPWAIVAIIAALIAG